MQTADCNEAYITNNWRMTDTHECPVEARSPSKVRLGTEVALLKLLVSIAHTMKILSEKPLPVGGSSQRKTMHFPRILIVVMIVISACTNPTRNNLVDPAIAPAIELSDPVLDNGTVLIQWRYPDRLLKSSPTETWSGAAPWTEIPLPTGAALTAFTFTSGNVAILDGLNHRLHLLTPDGEVRLSWDTPGTSFESGDIRGQEFASTETGEFIGWLFLVDSAGNLFPYSVDGTERAPNS